MPGDSDYAHVCPPAGAFSAGRLFRTGGEPHRPHRLYPGPSGAGPYLGDADPGAHTGVPHPGDRIFPRLSHGHGAAAAKRRQPEPAFRHRPAAPGPGTGPGGAADGRGRHLGIPGRQRGDSGQQLSGAADHLPSGQPPRHPGAQRGWSQAILSGAGLPEGAGLFHRAFLPAAGQYALFRRLGKGAQRQSSAAAADPGGRHGQCHAGIRPGRQHPVPGLRPPGCRPVRRGAPAGAG